MGRRRPWSPPPTTTKLIHFDATKNSLLRLPSASFHASEKKVSEPWDNSYLRPCLHGTARHPLAPPLHYAVTSCYGSLYAAPPHSCSVGTVPSLPHHLSSLTAVSLSLFHCSPSHQLYQLLVVFFWLITSLDMMLFVFVLLKLYIEIVRATLLKS